VGTCLLAVSLINEIVKCQKWNADNVRVVHEEKVGVDHYCLRDLLDERFIFFQHLYGCYRRQGMQSSIYFHFALFYLSFNLEHKIVPVIGMEIG